MQSKWKPSIIVLSIHDLTRRSTPGTERHHSGKMLSIHDLTRRSTLLQRQSLYNPPLSIHDLTRRSTQVRLYLWVHTQPFNSRPHKEVDIDRRVIPDEASLSIHDLTRRSTANIYNNLHNLFYLFTNMTKTQTFSSFYFRTSYLSHLFSLYFGVRISRHFLSSLHPH